MLIARHLGTPNSDFNGCHCMRDPVLYRSMLLTSCEIEIHFPDINHVCRLFSLTKLV